MLENIIKKYKQSYKYFVPFDFMLDDSIVVNKNGGFQVTLKLKLYDFDYVEPNEIYNKINKLNQLIKKISSGYTLHFEMQKNENHKYPTKNLIEKPIPTILIDDIRKENLLRNKLYKTDYYLTISYTINNDIKSKVDNLFELDFNNIFKKTKIDESEVSSQLKKYYDKELAQFKSTVSQIISNLENSICREVKLLEKEELLGYLYSAINFDKRDSINFPNDRLVMLDDYLTSSYIENKKNLKINGEYVKVLNISAFPNEISSQVFNDLEKLNFEYRYVTRFIILSKEEMLKKIKRMNFYYTMKLKNFLQWIVGAIKPSPTVDKQSSQSLDELDMIETELKSGELLYGQYTFSFIIKDKNLEELDKKYNLIKRIASEHDFIISDDKLNTLDAWFGSIPGNIRNNIRKSVINSVVLSNLIPISMNYLGERRNKHLKDVPLIVGRSGNEVFNFNLHIKDVGHTLITGPTGAGKSVLIGMIASNFMKYDNAQVVIFDKDSSSRVLTHTSGGKFYDLSKKVLSFQPLKNIHLSHEMEWATTWIISILEQENITITPKVIDILTEALKSLSEATVSDRTLSNFVTLVQDREIKTALSLYCYPNAYGQYFDSNEENIENNSFLTFEIGDVLKTPKIIDPLFDYLFHKIEVEKMNGNPTLIVFEEAWIWLKTKNKKMQDKIEEYLRTARKKNTSILFGTQSLDELINSEVFNVVKDSCLTKIFLPNENAITNKEMYKSFNLNDVQIQSINDGELKKDYFYNSNLGSRLFQLDLTKLELAFVGSSTIREQEKIEEIVEYAEEMYSNSSEKLKVINKLWLEYKNIIKK